MVIHNAEIAEKFDELADLLEIEEANPFRIRAYRNAARTIRSHPQSFSKLADRQVDLTRIPSIGTGLAQKIHALVTTGKLPTLEQTRRRTPGALRTLLKVRGLGPRRVRALHRQLKIRNLRDLERAARQGRIRSLPGFGPKTEAAILSQIAQMEVTERRFGRLEAEQIANPLMGFLAGGQGVKRVTIAGSLRRCEETVGDLDLLVTATRKSPVAERFASYDQVAEVLSKGKTRSSVRLRCGLQVDLRVVPESSYGAALHYFAGSKEHSIAVRTRAVKQGLKVNEYGVFRGDLRIAGRTETEVFKSVGLDYIPPELRENRGEIEAASKGKLPRLIELDHIRGDLHCHTRASDGWGSVRQMAEAATQRGYEYLAISDHSRQVRIAHGLDPRRLAAQINEIDRLNDELGDIVVLKSCEVDILENGNLDIPNKLLAQLDLTVCAVHYRFNLSRHKQTERILKASVHGT